MALLERRGNYWWSFNHEFLIVVFGAAIATVIHFVFPVTYFPDSDQYYNFGKAILGGDISNTSNFRGIGLPLILIISGVFLTGSFKGFVFLQLLMGVIIPLILYKLLGFWNKKFAFYISLFAVISLVPFGYAKAILSEQTYMFTLLLLLYNSIKLQQTAKLGYLYLQAVLIFILIIIKPIASFLFIIFLVYNILTLKKRAWHIACSFLLLFTLIFISNQYTNYLFENAPDHQKRQHMAGSILFYDLYLSSDIEGRSYDLNRIGGLRKLLKEINLYYLNHPDEYYANMDEANRDNSEAFKVLFRPYINNPVALSQANQLIIVNSL